MINYNSSSRTSK